MTVRLSSQMRSRKHLLSRSTLNGGDEANPNIKDVMLCQKANGDMVQIMKPLTLKAETETLCHGIEELEQRLGAKTIPFDDAKRLWNSEYQPKARILAESLLPYVPSEHLLVDYQDRDWRVVRSDVVTNIAAPLSEELASGQLCAVVKGLRRLTDYLPTEADA